MDKYKFWPDDEKHYMKSQRITKEVIIHSEENMNVFTKFHDNQSNCCWDISVKTTNVNLTTARGKSEDHQSQ